MTFEPDTRRQYLCLLGYDTEELDEKVHKSLQYYQKNNHSICSLIFHHADLVLQLSRFRSGAIATGAGKIDPSDLSQRLSTLPLEGDEGEGEGESAAIFGASEGIHTIFYSIQLIILNGCL